MSGSIGQRLLIASLLICTLLLGGCGLTGFFDTSSDAGTDSSLTAADSGETDAADALTPDGPGNPAEDASSDESASGSSPLNAAPEQDAESEADEEALWAFLAEETEREAGADDGPGALDAFLPPQTGAGRVVVLDPGHQASGDSTAEPNGPGSSITKARVTGGTRGRTTGVYEYELVLDIALQLRDELVSRGYTVFLTRESHDVNLSNMERAQYATAVGADIAVRIHANGVENSAVSGALSMAPSTSNPYCAGIAEESQRLARCVLDAYCARTGMANQGVTISDTMSGMNWSTVPVTILEMGYMTNPTDDTNMQDPVYQQSMVLGIADGIDTYFN